jgi:hypothetical protein
MAEVMKKGQLTNQPRAFGESGELSGNEFIRSFIAEDAGLFGRAAMAGTSGELVKNFASASGVFKGVYARSFEASNADNDAYAAQDEVGLFEKGAPVVFVEEDIAVNDTVRIRHTAKAATAGTATLSSAPLTFVGATVPALADNTYDIDISIDGTNYPCPTALLATDDWDGIAAKIQVVLRALTSSTETVAISAGLVLVTSATTGVASAVVITEGTTGSAGGGLIDAINQVTNMTVTIDVPVNGTLFPAGGFATTAEAGKTAVLTGARFEKASEVVDTTTNIRAATLILDGNFTITADT